MLGLFLCVFVFWFFLCCYVVFVFVFVVVLLLFLLCCCLSCDVAKGFLPRNPCTRQSLQESGIDPDRICLHCWCTEGCAYLEDEAHVFFTCSLYTSAREDLLQEVQLETKQRLRTATHYEQRLLALRCSAFPSDWVSIGRFCARTRQVRRKMRSNFTAKHNITT